MPVYFLKRRVASKGGGIDATLFINLALSYMFLLVLLWVINADWLKMIANVYAVAIFLILLIKTSRKLNLKNIGVGVQFALIVYYLGMILSWAVNSFSQDNAAFLKLLITPAFLIFGYSAGKYGINLNKFSRLLLISLILFLIVPVTLGVVDIVQGAFSFDSNSPVSIFINRNTAAVYLIAILALYCSFGLNLKQAIAYSLSTGLILGTLGVFVAVVMSLTYALVTRDNVKYLVMALPLGLIAILLIPNILVVDRLISAYGALLVVYTDGGGLANYSYAELIGLTGTEDLSLFFRLKHWQDISAIWEKSLLINQIFGSGVGASVKYTDAGLVPHNDYLRYFYECGVIPFIGFVLIQFNILKKIGRNYLAVPFLVVSIYFISENLVDNYLAMIIYYFSAGLILRRTGFREIGLMSAFLHPREASVPSRT